ncbi:MAG: DinB family protein [Bacteroidetes bacterium]|nr:DinB family protein [Bacteroidota bacterium]
MEIIPMLLEEIEQEAQTTRKMLALVPDDKYSWKPHEKSMAMGNLATHIAELPGWVSITLHTSELDFAAQPYKPSGINNTKDLLADFEKTLATAKADLSKTDETELKKTWIMRNGETIYTTRSKVDVIRMAYSQTVHHRAQLGVYLRLLNIPLPGSYGPTADNQHM